LCNFQKGGCSMGSGRGVDVPPGVVSILQGGMEGPELSNVENPVWRLSGIMSTNNNSNSADNF